jgi:hypothetical protein
VEVLAPVVTSANRAVAEAQGVELDAVDDLLAGVAATRPHADLAKAVAHYLARLNPDGPEPDPTEGRRLNIAEQADGSTTGRCATTPRSTPEPSSSTATTGAAGTPTVATALRPSPSTHPAAPGRSSGPADPPSCQGRGHQREPAVQESRSPTAPWSQNACRYTRVPVIDGS